MSLRPAVRFSQYRGHELITAPAIEPITLQQLADQIRGDSTDPLLDLYIAAARQQFEEYTGRALITQTWRMTLDRWPSSGAEPWWDGVRDGAIGDLISPSRATWVILPRYRLQSIDSITTFDEAGSSTSVTAADVFVTDTQQEPGRLVLKASKAWPVALQSANAIRIDYVAGYGTDAADVPAALRVALLQFAAHLYSHRGDDCSSEDAMRASGAMSTFRIYRAGIL